GVNQLAESAKAMAIRTKNQAGEGEDFSFVSFLRQCFALHDRSATQQISEFIVQLSQRHWRKWSDDADNKFFPNPASGMIYAIKPRDLVHRQFHLVEDFEEMEVLLRNEADLIEMLAHKPEPGFPVITFLFIEHDHWNDPRFPGL